MARTLRQLMASSPRRHLCCRQRLALRALLPLEVALVGVEAVEVGAPEAAGDDSWMGVRMVFQPKSGSNAHHTPTQTELHIFEFAAGCQGPLQNGRLDKSTPIYLTIYPSQALRAC